MRPVLGEALVTSFHMADLALDDSQRMLNLGPHLRDDPIDLFVELIKLTALWSLAHDAPKSIAIFREGHLLARMDTAVVSPDRCFMTVRHFVPELAVVGPGGSCLQAVGDSAIGIHAHMSYHLKIPVIALLCCRHLGIAGIGLVFRRGRGVDDRRTGQGAGAQCHVLVGKVGVHLSKQRFGWVILLQPMTEVEHYCLVGNAVVTKFDDGKPAHGLAIVKTFLRLKIAGRVPALQQVHTQHHLQWHWGATALGTQLRVVRLDQRQQLCLMYNRVHLRQEHLPPRHLLLQRVTKAKNSRLLGNWRAPLSSPKIIPAQAKNRKFFRDPLILPFYNCNF